jgi:hypothetical protein
MDIHCKKVTLIFAGLDGKFRVFNTHAHNQTEIQSSSQLQSQQHHQLLQQEPVKFPITNGSLFTSIDGRLPIIHNYRRGIYGLLCLLFIFHLFFLLFIHVMTGFEAKEYFIIHILQKFGNRFVILNIYSITVSQTQDNKTEENLICTTTLFNKLSTDVIDQCFLMPSPSS